MKKFPLLFLVLCFAYTLQGQATLISQMDGSYTDPNTWGGSVPTTADNVIMSHNIVASASAEIEDFTLIGSGTFTVTSGIYKVNGTTTISTGTLIDITTRSFRAKGEFINNGDITGATNGRFYIQNDGTISGTGTISLPGKFYLSGNRTITASTNMDKPNGQLWIGSVVIQNSGNFACDDIRASLSGSWVNLSGSSFTISGDPNNLKITASASGNTVTFDGSGTANQDIPKPQLGRFYNLTILGDDPASEKILTGDINILGELNIEGSTLRAGSATSYDIDIKGNWYNFGGVFDPQQGFVSFNGADDQEIDNDNGVENFFDLFFTGDGFLNLFVDLDVARNITIDKEFDTFGQSFNVGGSWTTTLPSFNLGGSSVTFDENYAGVITGDITFENVTINKTLPTDVMTIDPGTAVGVIGSMEIFNGILNTNDNLVIESNANRTGRIGDLSNGTINGDVEMHRFIDPVVNGWHLMSSCIQGQTLEDWNDDVITTGFPGSDYPDFDFNNATNYDETISGTDKDNGLMDATSSTQSISDLKAWRMYLAAGATDIDVKGTLYTGDQNIPLTYTNNGAVTEDGWNLIANPYPSAIDWDSPSGWSRSGVNDAYYIWDPSIEQYISWVGGMGTFTATQYIPSTQGFWVQTFQDAPSLVLSESAKANVDPEFKNNDLVNDNYFKVAIANGAGTYGEMGIRLDERATATFDRTLDAYYLKSTSETAPGIAVKDETGLAYSVYSTETISEETIIPIYVYVPNTQEYTFSFKNVSNFKKASCVKLIDNLTGSVTPISDESTFSLVIEEGEYENRFSFQLGAPVKSTVINENCIADQDKIQVIAPEGVNWTVNAYNSNNELVLTESTSGGLITSQSLDAGDYNVEVISDNGQCNTTYNTVTVPEQNNLDISITSTNGSVNMNNGKLNAEVEGGLAPYSFEWSNGSTTAAIQDLNPGMYMLTVTDARSCSYSTNVELGVDLSQIADNKSLESDEIKIWQFDGNLALQFDLELKQNYRLNVYNSVGQMTYSSSLNGVQYDRLNIPTENFKGVSLVVLQNVDTEETIVKKIAF